jgi:tRNA pseudouridine55 synthase
MVLRGPPSDRSPDELVEFGVVNLDKPPGPSSHQVAAWLRDCVGVDRAAHAGTLDPKVTGCLPVLLGDATRAAQVFDDSAKGYVAVLELHRDAPADFEAVVGEFEGPLLQKPPRKSAVSRRLRTRTVHDLRVLEREERRALLRIRCESGTYVRKLCHDLGLALGTGANMGDLRRVETDPFDDRTLVTMHDVVDALAFAEEAAAADGSDGAEAIPEGLSLRECVAPAERALVHLPGLTVAPSAAAQIAEGAPVYAPGVIDGRAPDSLAFDGRSPPAAGEADRGALVACYTPEGAAVCLGHLVGDPAGEEGTVVDLERVLV